MSTLVHPHPTTGEAPVPSRRHRSLRSTLQEVLTPLVAGLFLVLAGTGVLLFLDLWPSYLHQAHGWLGLIFLAAALGHLILHWRGFRHGLARPAALGALLLALLVGGILILGTAHEQGEGTGKHRNWSGLAPGTTVTLVVQPYGKMTKV